VDFAFAGYGGGPDVYLRIITANVDEITATNTWTEALTL
jgi:hypothetical protein